MPLQVALQDQGLALIYCQGGIWLGYWLVSVESSFACLSFIKHLAK